MDNSKQPLTVPNTKSPVFSVEFFPPQSEATADQLLQTAAQLRSCQPDFVSITYGAGGSTRNRTLKYARSLQNEFQYDIMPHLTCVGHSKNELQSIIHEFKESGFNRIMALRGDPPKGESNFTPHADGLGYANELVELIRETHPSCAIAVAGYPEKHPEAANPEVDLQNLKRKVDAGASFITTQLFFDNSVYFKFVDDCRKIGIHVPILPGLLSIRSREQAQRFCKMCEATFPEALDRQLIDAGEDENAVRAVGQDWLFHQAKELIEKGAPGIHLYILNHADAAVALLDKMQSHGHFRAKK
ncbi:MAG: methylenetetrahydrofolate reductase [NAD(P)H] [Coraliomargaritaceae bacterium]